MTAILTTGICGRRLALHLKFDWGTAGYLFCAIPYKKREFSMTEPHNKVVKIRVLPSFFLRDTLDDKVSLRKSKCLLETDHVKFIVGNIIFFWLN